MATVRADTKLSSQGFQAGLTKMQGSVQRFGQNVAQVRNILAGAFVTRMLVNYARKAIDLGSQLSDMAFQANVTTDQLQALSMAARDAGASDEQLTNALIRLRDAQGRVIQEDARMIEMFDSLGISQERVRKANTAELMEDIAKALRNAGRDSEQFSAMLQILGMRNAPKLEEALIRLGRDGLDPLIEQTKELGQLMGEDLIADLDAASDALGRFERRATVQMGGALNNMMILADTLKLMWRDNIGMMEAATKVMMQREVSNAIRNKPGGKPTATAGRGGGASASASAKGSSTFNASRESDELSKIGGLLGGVADPQRTAAQRQVALAEQQVDIARKMLVAAEETAKNTSDAGGMGA